MTIQYRETAVENSGVTDPVDEALTLAPRWTWLAATGVAIVVIAATVWSLVGKVPIVSKGIGILLPAGHETVLVVAKSNGVVDQINVKVGDFVKAGQVVATISTPVTMVNAELQEENTALLQRIDAQINQIESDQFAEIEKSSNLQIKGLEKMLAEAEELSTALSASLESKKDLLKGGLISQDAYLEAESSLIQTRNLILNLKDQISTVNISMLESKVSMQQQQSTRRFSLAQQAADSRLASATASHQSKVTSPTTGFVIAITSGVAQSVTQSTPVIQVLEMAEDNEDDARKKLKNTPLAMHGYLPLSTGKPAVPNMATQVSPTYAIESTYGFLHGNLDFVSLIAIDNATLTWQVQNQILARAIMKEGPAIEVTASLFPTDETISGYEWSSRKGYPGPISIGTEVTFKVVLREVHPIEIMIPWVANLYGPTEQSANPDSLWSLESDKKKGQEENSP